MADFISVINPATEQLIQEIPIDNSVAVSEKVARARAAQPKWALRPVEERIELMRRFKDLLVEQVDALAATLTAETGKPITQSRNEILATPARIDFFTENVAGLMKAVSVYREPADASSETVQLEEMIAYEALGVVANISAWNYPYFVGSNVFVPALLAGNSVLYKPSELATMTGLAIADLLYQAGVSQDVFIPVVGAGPTGAALLEEAIDGVFFTGSYRTGQKLRSQLHPNSSKFS